MPPVSHAASGATSGSRNVATSLREGMLDMNSQQERQHQGYIGYNQDLTCPKGKLQALECGLAGEVPSWEQR